MTLEETGMRCLSIWDILKVLFPRVNVNLMELGGSLGRVP
jgi:hypothetical protein